jgi:Fe-S cluster assembly protein SufD
MELQSSVGLDDGENTLQSIMHKSSAYLIIKNGGCDFELSNIPDGVSVYDGDKGGELITNILSDQFQSVAKDDSTCHLLVECDSSLILDEPLYIIFVDSDKDDREKVYRNFYLLKEGAEITIIEKQLSNLENNKTQTLSLFSSWFLEKNASLIYYGFELPNKVLDYSINNSIIIRQMENSSCSFFTFYWEQGVTNNEIEVFLDGEFATCKLYSASLLLNSTIVNNSVKMNHNSPNCESVQLYKGVYSDNSSSQFNSLVYVKKDAQKTSSMQQNNNIMLSDYASVKSNPQLEIFADDVKCAHGSTIGQIDPNALFYLQSRGIGKEAGIAILLQSFLGDVVNEVSNLELKDLVLNEFNKILDVNHYYEL